MNSLFGLFDSISDAELHTVNNAILIRSWYTKSRLSMLQLSARSAIFVYLYLYYLYYNKLSSVCILIGSSSPSMIYEGAAKRGNNVAKTLQMFPQETFVAEARFASQKAKCP